MKSLSMRVLNEYGLGVLINTVLAEKSPPPPKKKKLTTIDHPTPFSKNREFFQPLINFDVSNSIYYTISTVLVIFTNQQILFICI